MEDTEWYMNSIVRMPWQERQLLVTKFFDIDYPTIIVEGHSHDGVDIIIKGKHYRIVKLEAI
jgi:hypothetical protein